MICDRDERAPHVGLPRISAARDRHEQKVAFLGSPTAYPDQPSHVERTETHFSWVFLTHRYVYKLKKPLRGDGFDFSSAEARRRNAEEEVRLNRRLAHHVYIGIVPLTLERECDLAIAGAGVVVDWLVEMVRIPAERMLDHRLALGAWGRADINTLGDRLARFFATARRVNMTPTVYLDRFRAECRHSRHALRCSGRPALQHAAQFVARRIEAFIFCRNDLLLRRLYGGRLASVVRTHYPGTAACSGRRAPTTSELRHSTTASRHGNRPILRSRRFSPSDRHWEQYFSWTSRATQATSWSLNA